MDRNTITAFVLAFLLILAYQAYNTMVVPPVPPPAPQGTATNAPAATPATTPIATSQTSPADARPLSPTTAPSEEKTIKIETDLYSAVMTTKGGTFKSIKLKNYKDIAGKNISLVSDGEGLPPLAIGSGGDFSASKADYKATGGDIVLDSKTNSGSVSFDYASTTYSIRRTFTFHNGKYAIDVKDEVLGLPQYELVLGTNFGISSEIDPAVHTGPVALVTNKRSEYTLGDLKKPEVLAGQLQWMAQEDKYFFAGVVPSTPFDEMRVFAFQNSAEIALKGKPGVSMYTLLAGPKDVQLLEKYGLNMEHIVDFGIFSFIARPIFWILKFLNNLIGNYGWSIIALTIVVRIPFIPLINKSQSSMKKMQDLQPKMREIMEKYKNDANKKNQEVMELYKKHQVSPLGGCLPMLIQIPVFIALYKVLLVAIELRQAPFIFWIKDLAFEDPLYIFPIGFGLTMFLQQKLTPTPVSDPQQEMFAKITKYFMPAFLTYIFLHMASGLTLYFFVGNLLSIAQQVYTNSKNTKS